MVSIILLLAVAAIVPLARALRNVYWHRLRKFPGPRLAAASNLPYVYWTFAGILHIKIKQLHDEYGPVVRIGPKALTYRSPGAWKEIYGHRKHGDEPFEKDPTFYVPSPSGAAITTAPNEDHARHRHLLSHAFSERALKAQEPLLQQYVDVLMQKLDDEINASPDPVDMTKWYNFITFDIIGDLTFGEPFNCLCDSGYDPWVSFIFQAVKAQTFMRCLSLYPGLATYIKPLLPKELMRRRMEHHEMSTAKVHRRLQTKTDRPDFMTYILRYNDERGLTQTEIEANAFVLLAAGSETTATALCGCTFYLATNPTKLEILCKEIRGAFLAEQDITLLAVSKLNYLSAVLEESLRLYPPLPGLLPRRVPNGGAYIEGQFVPEGVSVSVAHFSAYRATSNFVDPDSFHPERWLDHADTRFANDQRDALQPFSYGPRNCIGKNLAYAEMRLIMARLLWNFDISLSEESLKWDDQRSYSIWQKEPLMIRLARARH